MGGEGGERKEGLAGVERSGVEYGAVPVLNGGDGVGCGCGRSGRGSE